MRLLLLFLAVAGCAAPGGRHLLESWRETEPKRAIIDFVTSVTDPTSPDYVPPAERVATFDNDGTLWSEKPAYFQLLFAIERVKKIADEHPEWKTTQPFQAVLENDREALIASGEAGLVQLLMATHAGMTTDEFEVIVTDWVLDSRHPRFDRPFTDLVYQPMLELLRYLRANNFKIYITSGGGIDFMRPWVERVYGIPPENTIGSTIETKFEMRATGPVLVKEPKMDFVDDKAGKPVAIHKFIGRRPIASFGNSDGDLQMLQWTAAGEGARLLLLVRHTDGKREWKYDRESHVGRLDKALDEAKLRKWIVVDMERDWATIYPFQLDGMRKRR